MAVIANVDHELQQAHDEPDVDVAPQLVAHELVRVVGQQT
jgi:hypothetical protein